MFFDSVGCVLGFVLRPLFSQVAQFFWLSAMTNDFNPNALGFPNGFTDYQQSPEGRSPVDLIEVAGTIKWFDVAKGYGFIIPDNGMADILLHATVLRREGMQIVYEGARVVVDATQGRRGWQVFRLKSVDSSTAIHPAQMPPPRTHVTVVANSGLERAIVKWFNRIRGFGFVSEGEGKPDIFVHMEILRRYGIADLVPGQTVFVRYGPGPKGQMATEVRLVDQPALPPSH